ncbi:hypothetical protein J6590_019703 [Homalodisca vitripennis]|nr:hypothetical protein J6590_019703 [Homalodisca vitripennis]
MAMSGGREEGVLVDNRVVQRVCVHTLSVVSYLYLHNLTERGQVYSASQLAVSKGIKYSEHWNNINDNGFHDLVSVVLPTDRLEAGSVPAEHFTLTCGFIRVLWVGKAAHRQGYHHNRTDKLYALIDVFTSEAEAEVAVRYILHTIGLLIHA